MPSNFNPPIFDTTNSSMYTELLKPTKNTEIEVNLGIEGSKDEGKVFIIQGKIALEAVEDKILILLDKFKTGYECKTCDGDGILQRCPTCKGCGVDRFEQPCKDCIGGERIFPTDCWTCKGKGATIVVPDRAKQIPTSGIIVSCGPACEKRKLGERVLFGAHTGYYLPFKGNVRLRLMREHEVMCLMYKVDPNVTTADFQLLEEAINNNIDL